MAAIRAGFCAPVSPAERAELRILRAAFALIISIMLGRSLHALQIGPDLRDSVVRSELDDWKIMKTQGENYVY
jgi:hypothetical protein